MSEQRYHINYLELLAAFLALKTFTKELTNCKILLKLDNTTAISYINRMGGVRFPVLNSITKQIWQWCEERGLWIFASYIPSHDNVKADKTSRVTNIDTEWALAQEAFQIIVAHFGKPDIDLFASRINTKCQFVYSWHGDPEALGIDSFTYDWKQSYFYAFPPFNLMLRVLNKIRSDRACSIVVAPFLDFPTVVSFIGTNVSCTTNQI